MSFRSTSGDSLNMLPKTSFCGRDEMIQAIRPTAAELVDGKTGKLTGVGCEFQYSIDKGCRDDPDSSTMVTVGKTAAAGK